MVRVDDAALTSVMVKPTGEAVKSDTKTGKRQSAEEDITDKPSRMSSQQNVKIMGIAQVEGPEPDRRICFASIVQNVLRNTSRVTPSLSIKKGGKWVRLQRDNLEDGEN